MLFQASRALGIQLVVIAGIIVISSIVVYLVDGKQAMEELLSTGVEGMKGPWVWTFGAGLAMFIMNSGRHLAVSLTSVLSPGEAVLAAAARIERSTLHRAALRYTLPITVAGIVLTWAYVLPNDGLGRLILSLMTISIYYIGGFLLFHFVEIMRAFHELFDRAESVHFRYDYSPAHLENITTYLSITTGLGLIGIYAGFRGTLTAGFLFPSGAWRSFLVTPVVLFLPGTLLYNYYPRYVLRKILQFKVFEAMSRLSTANEQDSRGLLMDLREAAVTNGQILPFLDYKSLPSYLIAILFAISIAYSNDPAVRAFFERLLNLTAP